LTDSEKKKPGPEPETFKVPLPFEDAVRAALDTPPPTKAKKRRKKK
jgi:hypothetical protein